MNYLDLNKEKLEQLLDEVNKEYKAIRAKGYAVDISRGKPCSEQLDFGMEMYNLGDSLKRMPKNYRNYGMLDGIPEMKQLFGDMLGLNADEIIVCGNSSLNLMYDTVQRNLQFGVCGQTPWNQVKAKFICPVPGYDRHFAICEHFGIEMISVPMDENGPVMDVVEKLVALDDTIKGIWCVPKYSNPTGITFSDKVVERIATMKVAAPDFRVFWDNAYVVHSLYDTEDKLKNIFDVARKAGTIDRIYSFASTSKVTFAGSGIAAMAASETNIKSILKHMFYCTIGPNKMNQVIHAEFLKNLNGVKEVMKQHAAILRPKFELFEKKMAEAFEGDEYVKWSHPKGGYFISLDVKSCAKRIVEIAAEGGVKFTAAGSTFPYKIDDKNSNIRIAPSCPSLEEMDFAIDVLISAIKQARMELVITKYKNK